MKVERQKRKNQHSLKVLRVGLFDIIPVVKRVDAQGLEEIQSLFVTKGLLDKLLLHMLCRSQHDVVFLVRNHSNRC